MEDNIRKLYRPDGGFSSVGSLRMKATEAALSHEERL